MGIAELAFYAFSMSTLIGGIFTVVARNPVHSVLWLILGISSRPRVCSCCWGRSLSPCC